MLFDSKQSKVVNLKGSDFYQGTLVTKKPTFVMFYAPWCPHCTRMKGEWMKLADMQKDITVAALDCEKYNAIASEARVPSFPTLRFYVDGKLYTYDGDRNAADMGRFVEHYMPFFEGSEYVNELGDKDLKTLLTSKKPRLVLFYMPWCKFCKDLKQLWPSLGHTLGTAVDVEAYNCMRSPKLTKALNIQSYPTIVMFNKGLATVFDGERNMASLLAFACETAGACESQRGRGR